MTGYWDIHNHILPGVDDGSSCMRETMSLLQAEYEQGIRHLIVTPHYRRGMFEIGFEDIQKVYEKTRLYCEETFPSMHLYLGRECFVSSVNRDKAPIMLSSSIQATLAGRFGNSEYGRSKQAGEELFFQYGKENDVKVAVYRFPNLLGHSRPKYNSAVSTFCWAVANDEEFTVNDRSTELELLYIDDLVEGMFDLLEGKEQNCEFDGVETVADENGRYCYVPVTHKVTLGEIVDLLQEFKEQPVTLMMPKMPDGSFAKKLYSLYLTYLPTEKFKYALKMNVDDRGSFTELVHTQDCGQVSVNISRPGITKGQHWHNSKWELFIVVAGHGLIQERNINTGEKVEFEVSGDKIEAIHMIPGWTHNIINLSETENLVTVMTCNEIFDSNHPDTFGEPV